MDIVYGIIFEKKLKKVFDLTVDLAVGKNSDFSDPCVPGTRLALFTSHNIYAEVSGKYCPFCYSGYMHCASDQ